MNILALFCILLALPSPTLALNLENVREPLKLISAQPISSTVEPEQHVPIRLNLKLNDGFHGYEDKIRIFPIQPDGTKVGGIVLKPKIKFVDFAKKEHFGFEKEFSMEFFIELPKDQKEDLKSVEFDIDYVACTEKFCLPRNKLSVTVPIVSSANSGAAMATSSGFALPDSKSIESHIEGNLLFALVLIFIFGFLTSLTPCVYPLIPITLAVVGARAAHKSSQLQAFLLSCVYVQGIATTYSILGVLAAQTGSLFGQALSYPSVVIGFSILFFAMALSIFGVFEIAIPSSITDKFQSKSGNKSYLSAYSAGLIAGVVASPCVGPVLVGVLAYIAKTQSLLLGFVLLYTFAMGMGVLFIGLGTFSGFISKIPKSGPWMNLVKYVLGTMLLGLSLYYLNPIITEAVYNFMLGLYIATSIGFLYALTTPKKRGSIFIFAVFTVLILSTGYSQLVKHSSTATSAEESEDEWQDYSAELVSQAKSEGKPVIIDFYADWCGACVELDEKTFSTDEFKEATKDYFLLRVDATEHFDGLDELQKQYEVYGLPTIIFINNKGEFRKDLSLTGFEDIESFLKRLKEL